MADPHNTDLFCLCHLCALKTSPSPADIRKTNHSRSPRLLLNRHYSTLSRPPTASPPVADFRNIKRQHLDSHGAYGAYLHLCRVVNVSHLHSILGNHGRRIRAGGAHGMPSAVPARRCHAAAQKNDPTHFYCKKCDFDGKDWEDSTKHKVEGMKPFLAHPPAKGKHIVCERCGDTFNNCVRRERQIKHASTFSSQQSQARLTFTTSTTPPSTTLSAPVAKGSSTRRVQCDLSRVFHSARQLVHLPSTR